MIEVKIVNTSSNQLPQYESVGASGLDVKANLKEPIELGVFEVKVIPTGYFVEIPEGYEIQVRSRSGLAAKSGIIVLNSPGTIDSDYRGEIGVILINLGTQKFTINNGDRIAQLVLCPVEKIQWDNVICLGSTERNSGGFGSTGV